MASNSYIVRLIAFAIFSTLLVTGCSKSQWRYAISAAADVAEARAEARKAKQERDAQILSTALEIKYNINLYVTKYGKKYHRDGCRYLWNSQTRISLIDAVRYYSPCSVCLP